MSAWRRGSYLPRWARRHGHRDLLEIADYVLDNASRLGDASLDLPGVAEAMAPTSTITGAALIHAAWAGAGEKLAAAGHVPEVWGSVNRAPSIPNP